MTLTNIKKMKDERGFTIVELLIVIVIIAILAAIVIVAYNGVQNRAKTASAQSAANGAIQKAEAFNADDTTGVSGYPTYPAQMTGAASSKTYYLNGATFSTAATTAAPATTSQLDFYTCGTAAGVQIKYWNYSTGALVTMNAGDTSGTCTYKSGTASS